MVCLLGLCAAIPAFYRKSASSSYLIPSFSFSFVKNHISSIIKVRILFAPFHPAPKRRLFPLASKEHTYFWVSLDSLHNHSVTLIIGCCVLIALSAPAHSILMKLYGERGSSGPFYS